MSQNVLNKKSIGDLAEQKACDFLQAKGLILVTRNFRCSFGEIDLIMKDHDEIVFIEVRSRAYADFGHAEESVDYKKQKKILNTAARFLEIKNWQDTVNCRFDVIGFLNDNIHWVKDAFIYE